MSVGAVELGRCLRLEDFPHYSGFRQYKNAERVCNRHLLRPWFIPFIGVFTGMFISCDMCSTESSEETPQMPAFHVALLQLLSELGWLRADSCVWS